MSEEISVEDEQEVQYVLNETEFVLDSSEINAESLSDIIYADGTRAILVNGHILQGDAQTVVLQDGEDLSQYYINDENGEILVADEEDSSENQTLVQYVDDDGNTADETQVVYINNEAFTIQDTDLAQYQIAEEPEEKHVKQVKLETQVVDLEELMRQQGEGETPILENFNEGTGYQYALLKDGKLHIQTYNGEVYPVTTSTDIDEPEMLELTEEQEQQRLDLSKITGRNLLTGQTVTLHSYMDKLQKKLKNNFDPIWKNSTSNKEGERNVKKRKIKKSEGLNDLLNKKITLGKTSNGKRLVGKIIHVGKPIKTVEVEGNKKTEKNVSQDIELENNKEQKSIAVSESGKNGVATETEQSSHNPTTAETNPQGSQDDELGCTAQEVSNDPKKIVIQEKIVSKECFEHISRTLAGLMEMDSVKRKLLYKNIIVKVVEKKYTSATEPYTKNVSFSSGYMDEEYTVSEEGEMSQCWTFVPDSNTKEAIFGKSGDDEESRNKNSKYTETTNLTLMLTQEKTGERVIRVILNPANGPSCSICRREFRSNLQLRVHISNMHQLDGSNKLCELCGNRYETSSELQEHRKMHVGEGKLFHCCVTGCGKFFLSAGRLKRHSAVHNITMRPLECSVCLHRCASESGLKKHLMTHMNIKPFYCEVCGKGFTNPGDLNFHKRIHDPYRYYACDICKRTFSRHSNLQRHVEIHKGSGELFQCAICGCSYHYMSSLTRHVVQNHIKRIKQPDSDTLENEIDENEIDENELDET